MIEFESRDQLTPEITSLRREVFVEEQQVPENLEWDTEDESATHVAVFEDGLIIACARIINTGNGVYKLGRMAVRATHRGKGNGKLLLGHLIETCLQANNDCQLELSAQCHARAFYAQFGFVATGATYPEAGIEHIRMVHHAPRLFMACQDRSTGSESHNIAAMTKNEDDTIWHFDNASDQIALSSQAINQCDHLIQIYSPDLEKAVYDSPKLVQLISKFCRKDRLTQVQILILDENALISSHHRLAELASRLTSKIKLHIVNKTLPYENSAFLLCDEQMLVFRKDIEDGKGYAAFTNRPEVKQLREKFEAMWLRSNASRENRTLGL